MNLEAGQKVKMTLIAEASPMPGMTLDQLEIELRGLGHKIMEVDRVNNKIKVEEVEHTQSVTPEQLQAIKNSVKQ